MLAMHMGKTLMLVSTITAIPLAGASASVGECSGSYRAALQEETSLLQVGHSLRTGGQRFPEVQNMTMADEYVAALVKDTSLFKKARTCFDELHTQWADSYASYGPIKVAAEDATRNEKQHLDNYDAQAKNEEKVHQEGVDEIARKFADKNFKGDKKALGPLFDERKQALFAHQKNSVKEMDKRRESVAAAQKPLTIDGLKTWAESTGKDVDDVLCGSMIITKLSPLNYHVTLSDSSAIDLGSACTEAKDLEELVYGALLPYNRYMAVPLVETPLGTVNTFGEASRFHSNAFTKHVSLFKCVKGLNGKDEQIDAVCSECTKKIDKCLEEWEGNLDAGELGAAKEVQFDKLLYRIGEEKETKHACP